MQDGCGRVRWWLRLRAPHNFSSLGPQQVIMHALHVRFNFDRKVTGICRAGEQTITWESS